MFSSREKRAGEYFFFGVRVREGGGKAGSPRLEALRPPRRGWVLVEVPPRARDAPHGSTSGWREEVLAREGVVRRLGMMIHYSIFGGESGRREVKKTHKRALVETGKIIE
jgi:hypothetical protein